MTPEQQSAPHLVASSLTIVDSQGRPRIIATVSDDYDTVFALRDAEGHDRVQVAVGRTGTPVVTLMNPAGNPGVQITYDRDLGPHIMLGNDQGRACIGLRVDPSGYPVVTLVGPEGSESALVCAIPPDGKPLVSGVDAAGVSAFRLT